MTAGPALPPDHDPETVAALAAVLGVDRVTALLAQLGQEIAALDAGDAPALLRSLHRLRGSSASLGLPRLAAAIAAIEAEAAAAPVSAQRLATLAEPLATGAAAALAGINGRSNAHRGTGLKR